MKNLLLKKVEKNCILLIILLMGSFGYAQIAQRGIATTATSTNTTLTINKPTGLVVNDLMIVNLAQGNNNSNAPTSSGWTSIDGRSLAGGTKRYGAVLYKIADATDVAASNFVFTMGSGTDSASGAIIAFSGVDVTNPFDAASGIISVQGNQTAVVATTTTTVTANSAIIMLGQAVGSTPSWSGWTTTSPGTLTELFDVSQGSNTQTTVGGAWALKAATGATGTGGATLSFGERNGGILLALKPCVTNTITLSSAVGTNAQTRCINTAITNITYNTTGASGATFSGLPAGVSGNWASNVVTISGTPSASGTFNYTVTLTGGCGSVVTANGTITVNPNNTATLTSAVGTNNQTLCINTAITNITYSTTSATGATFSGLPTGVTGNWAANVATISGIPSVSGTFNYTVTLTGGCGTITATGTINALINTITLSSGAGTNNQTRCINTAMSSITFSTVTATGATFSGLPTGVSGNWAANVVTISGTPSVSGSFPYTVTLTGGCGPVTTASGTITVNPNNTVTLTSAVGTNNQTRCINTAITNITYSTTTATGATFSGLPTGVTGNWAANVVTISGTPSVSGTFNYTVTLTGGCGTVTATGTITVTPNNTITLTSGAGTNNQTSCINTAITNITYSTTGATGATFSGLPTGVTGNWAANMATISGTPTVSGTFNYTITLTGGCGVVTATGTNTVNPNNTITLTSGVGTNNQTRCINIALANITFSTVTASGATFSGLPTGVSGNWAANVVTISGTPSVSGTFPYIVTLTGGCGPVTTTSGTITVNPNNIITLTSAVGTNNQTVCISTAITNITYSTTSATGATFSSLPAGVTGNWAANVVTISGTPSVSGTFNFTVTLTGGCGTITATGIITVTPNNTITLSSAVGTNSQTRCINNAITNITYNTISATGATFSGLPAGVTGNWASNVVTISGTPSASGTFNYTVTLTGGCGSTVTAVGTITVIAAATSVAGTDINACATSGAVNITTGSSATNYSSVTWTSNGTGTFTNANSLTTCTYTPSAADITAGTRTITLTANGNTPCGNVTSTKTITIFGTPTAVAGPILNMCGVGGAFNITSGSSATNYSLVTWTSSGTGSFTNSNSLTTCTYTPSAADTTAGNVTLTLTVTGNAPCGNATSTKTLNITGPTASAGTSLSTCSTTGAINITAGASATNYTSVTWTSNGTGTFTNANSLTTCTYTPSAADISAGTRTLTLTASNGVCSNDTSVKTLTIYVSPTITGTTPASRTGAGTLILGATASVGTVYWYAALTGGTSLGFGTSFSTPSISVTTTYYVEAVNGTCTSSPRVAVVATVNYPEMDIQGNATSIPDGDITPLTTDWTDFGSVNLTRTFTIRNTGAGVLNLGAITISGTNSSEYTVTTAPSSPIASGSSTTFTVTFNPTAAGIRTATISIANNDTDENPYDFAIQGTGVAREINIQGNATSIVDGDFLPSTTDWTDFSTIASTRTFTIQNTGNVILNIGAITIDGTNAADFSITTPPSATVAAYGSTTFVVSFIPSAINVRTAAIHIVNNDTDENPYDFSVQGFGIIPEIDIQGNAISIADGDASPSTTDWTDFSTTNVTRTYTIFNQGNTILTVGAITFSGTNAADFSVTTLPSASVSAFGSTTFTVTFNPSAAGVRTAAISIVNNDSTGGENPYNYAIQGTGVAREMNVQGNATSIVDGDTSPTTTDWTDFSSVTYTRTFTVQNTGNMPLTIGAITFVGGNNTDFAVTSSPSALIGAFGSTTFTVTFTPSGIGTRVTTMNIANNDSDENPYDIRIQGLGGTPEINIISQYNVSIVDGDTTPSTTDQTDFGTVSIENGSVTINLVIQNTGTGALTVGAATFSGANASDFSIVTAPSSTVSAGGTSRFQISFNPTTKGTKTATFTIVNNDSNENPYNFDLTGLGVQTYLDTDGDTVTDNEDLDDDNDGINDIKEHTDGLAYPLTGLVQYTFLNETFGTGTTRGQINVNTPGATSTYCYENGYGSACDASVTLEDGEYCVNYRITGPTGLAADPENIHGDLAWYENLDHTPSDTNGRMAVFNASFPAGTFYETQIDGVIPNVPISYSFWALNIMRQSNFPSSILPNITVEFLDLSNNLISSFNTGNIGRCTTSNATDNTCAIANWLQYSTSVNLGNITSFIVRFKNNSTGGGGNDLAIDDINITQNYIDTDGDGVANIFDLDDENDGISDVEEAGFKAYSNGLSKIDITAGTWVDANGNGLLDAIEAQISGGTYSIADTDGDLVPNYLDLDSDNDSFFDVDEAGTLNGDGDINGDGRGDLVDTDRDGILDLYDNNTGFGTTVRSYAADTDSNGIADYLQLDSNNDGTKDIVNGLYNSLDGNNDGIIDGAADVDKDGILDTFDTNTLVIGSPRDLNRKLFLDFDGRNDYAENTAILGGLANATLMAWIDLNSTFSATGVVVGQDKFQIRVSSSKTLQAIVNGTTVTFATALNTTQWYHVAATYGGGNLNLYLNGKLVATQAIAGSIAADATKLTLGKNPLSATNYFKGKIDEVRVFNTALTALQVQRMVYQEIQNSASQVRGLIVPKDVGSLTFSNVLRYYRMDAYKDDIVDDLTTTSIDAGTGMKMFNHKVINVQQAPMPFTTIRTGTFSSAVNDATKDIRGLDVLDYDASIIQVKHNITETANSTDLAMFVDPGVTINMTNDTKIQNDWYLKLDGKIDLVGKSQFVQTTNSDLDVTSAGSLERDQQGQSNKFNYNYWSSPVSSINSTTINHGYTVAGVMKDATDVNNIQNLQWTTGINGSATTPITLSSYWIFKFQNSSNAYANWASAGQNGTLLPGQGYTMKGAGAATANQNYTYVGKPNNGTITSTVGANNLNLCGNPYPSAIDADQFIDDNATSLKGTLYIWEHYSTNSSHNTIQYQGGYATYTKTGGTAPVAPAGISGLGSSSKTPKRFIPVGQGFFVTGSATGGTITFNNGQRLFIKEDDVANSYTMFRSTNPTVATVNPAFNNAPDSFIQEQFMKLRLGYNSADNYHRQTLLGFMNQHATAGYDNGYDAISIETLTNDMYFINGTDKLNINGDGYFNVNNIYPLGVKNAVAGNVTFVVDGKENFPNNQEIYIYDNVTATYNSIKSQNFQINLPVGTYDTRFSLRFKNTTALETTDNEIVDHGITVIHSQANNMINIKNELQEVTVKSVSLYNLLGQDVMNWNITNENQAKIELQITNLSTGTYIVKVITEGGDITKKILVK